MPAPRVSPFLDCTLLTLWCSPGGSATVGFLNLGHPCPMLHVGRGCSLHPGVLFSRGSRTSHMHGEEGLCCGILDPAHLGNL